MDLKKKENKFLLKFSFCDIFYQKLDLLMRKAGTLNYLHYFKSELKPFKLITIILFCLQAIAFVAFIAVAAAGLLPTQQASSDAQAQVLRSESIVNPESFQYVYETSNGIRGQEAGQLKQIGESQGIATQGEFSWNSPDGQPIQFSFVADENGYQPQGDFLPTPPPIPEAIVRTLRYLAEHAQPQQ